MSTHESTAEDREAAIRAMFADLRAMILKAAAEDGAPDGHGGPRRPDQVDPFHRLFAELVRTRHWLRRQIDRIVEFNPQHEDLARYVRAIHSSIDSFLSDTVCQVGDAGDNLLLDWLSGQIVDVALEPVGVITAENDDDPIEAALDELQDRCEARLVCPVEGCDRHFGDGGELRDHIRADHADQLTAHGRPALATA